MKKYNLFLIIAMIFASLFHFSTSSYAQEADMVKIKSLKNLSKKFVTCLRLENFNGIKELYPSKEVLRKLYHNDDETQTVANIRAVSNLRNLFNPSNFSYYEEDFESVIAKGKKLGIDWEQLKFVSLSYCFKEDDLFSKKASVYLKVQYYKQKIMVPIHPVKIDSGWYLLPIVEGEIKVTELKKPQNVNLEESEYTLLTIEE